MKCLKGCDVAGVRYEPGDDIPTDGVSKKDLKWLAKKGCVAPLKEDD